MCTVLLEDFSYCLEFHDRNIFFIILGYKIQKAKYINLI